MGGTHFVNSIMRQGVRQPWHTPIVILQINRAIQLNLTVNTGVKMLTMLHMKKLQ